MNQYNSIFEGYKERIGRIALFDLFYQMDKKQKTDHQGKQLDYFGMYLVTLIFFFENMLQRNRQVSIEDLSVFLKTTFQKHYTLDYQGYEDIARSFVEAMRPTSGRRNYRQFYNYETEKEDRVEYSLLKVAGWDQERNVQYYALDEQGLELIFATKEYFSEFQISISQLILRKQLEKGEFVGALRQIDEMQIGVQSIKEKINHIKHEVQRNIVSDEIYGRYQELIEDINRRLKREHEEFEEIATFVQETKDLYERSHHLSEKDQGAFSMVIRIDNELADVHHLHGSLLEESIELKMSALKAARESLYFIGVSSFNFEQEIVGKMLSLPMPLEETEVIAHPYLGRSQAKIWSPLAVFAPQWIKKEGEELPRYLFIEPKEKEQEQRECRQQHIYQRIFSAIYPTLQQEKKVTLEALGKVIPEAFLQVRETYDFFIVLHQMSPINLEDIQEQPDHVFYEAFKELFPKYKWIQGVELRKTIQLNSNYMLRDMEIMLSDKEL